MSRDLDLVMFGATGFTGKLVAEYIASLRATSRGGRSRAATRPSSKRSASTCPILVVDAHDRSALDALAEPHEGRVHDRRAVREVRQRAGRRVRRGRHALLRSHRRGAVDAPDDRCAPRARDSRPARGSCTPAASTRSRAISAPGRSQQEFKRVLALRVERHRAVRRDAAAASRAAPSRARWRPRRGRQDREIRKMLGNPYGLDPDPDARRPRVARRGVDRLGRRGSRCSRSRS